MSDYDDMIAALRASQVRELPTVEHLELIVAQIDADPHTLDCPLLHWTGIYLLRLIARERGLL